MAPPNRPVAPICWKMVICCARAIWAKRSKSFGGGPAPGGRVQEFTWDGEIVWDFKFFNEKQLPHHDITHMPNGNVMMIVWDRKTPDEAIKAGRLPNLVGTHLLPDSLVEIKPTGKTTGEVVWEWHLWDHLVQEADKDKPNFGKVAEHPELVDVNLRPGRRRPVRGQEGRPRQAQRHRLCRRQYRQRQGSAIPTGRTATASPTTPISTKLALSVHNFSEFWIIDHSTSTAEAASHKGGKSGKGGDLLYRWGNPRAYGAGSQEGSNALRPAQRPLDSQGLPGAGHLLSLQQWQRPARTALIPRSTKSSRPLMPRAIMLSKTGAAYRPRKGGLELSCPQERISFPTSFPVPNACPMATRSFAPEPTASSSK